MLYYFCCWCFDANITVTLVQFCKKCFSAVLNVVCFETSKKKGVHKNKNKFNHYNAWCMTLFVFELYVLSKKSKVNVRERKVSLLVFCMKKWGSKFVHNRTKTELKPNWFTVIMIWHVQNELNDGCQIIQRTQLVTSCLIHFHSWVPE